MHVMPFHLGDYAAATTHLTDMEDLAYRRALDRYYITEQPLPLDVHDVARLLRLRNQVPEVDAILKEFFRPTPAGWLHARVEREILRVEAMRQRNSANGKKGGRPPKNNPVGSDSLSTGLALGSDSLSTGNPVESEKKATVKAPVPRTPYPVPRTPKEDSVSSLRSETARSALFGDPDQWDEAVAGFGRQGIEEKPARKHIGKLVRDFGPDQVFRLLHLGIERGVPDLAGYVEGAAAPLRKSTEYRMSHITDEEVERMNSRGAHPIGWRNPK